MEARAILRYARISPRKVSIVMDLIRNKPLDEALAILQYTPKAACEPLLKLVKSAAANAENNFNMDKNNLYVAECYVCPGPTLKRMMPRAQGRGYRILKRTSFRRGSQAAFGVYCRIASASSRGLLRIRSITMDTLRGLMRA